MGHRTSEHLSSPLIRSSLQSCNTSLSRSLRDVLMIMERIQEALQSIGEVRLLEKSLTPTRRIR